MKTKIFRKIKIVAALLLCPIVLSAQNGVTVSGLAVDAGTVTFNVSWKTPMPVSPWSDTVWVFVDYNNVGRMERLPVTGATASAGTVTKISGNDKGVWIVGNARANGSFSATVKLLFNAATNVAGACAYASNYPPVGEYISGTELSFTGTPPYEIVLKDSGSGTITRESGSPFSVPASYTVQSFSDKTGAPGIMSCTPPGATVNFTAFNPCNTATTGNYWYLTDTRESNNVQTYKVKKMADGHIWMVQDLKFGDKCNKTTFTGSDGKDQTGNVTSLTDKTYYGDCTNVKTSLTPSNRGYMYDWAAAINKPGAYRGSNADVGCTGTGSTANACQGICPEGWRVPTGDANGDYQFLINAYPACTTASSSCWL
ncbi:MAG: hypothetical protein LBT61_04550, partial [Prevotellaceae bacterium]|nr:hypothetical protein [Prevotellaceae bacterium]